MFQFFLSLRPLNCILVMRNILCPLRMLRLRSRLLFSLQLWRRDIYASLAYMKSPARPSPCYWVGPGTTFILSLLFILSWIIWNISFSCQKFINVFQSWTLDVLKLWHLSSWRRPQTCRLCPERGPPGCQCWWRLSTWRCPLPAQYWG